MNQQFLYRFTPEEKAVIDKRFADYISAVRVIAEMHGLDRLGVPLNTDPKNTGFLANGIEVKQGEGK